MRWNIEMHCRVDTENKGEGAAIEYSPGSSLWRLVHPCWSDGFVQGCEVLGWRGADGSREIKACRDERHGQLEFFKLIINAVLKIGNRNFASEKK